VVPLEGVEVLAAFVADRVSVQEPTGAWVAAAGAEEVDVEDGASMTPPNAEAGRVAKEISSVRTLN
jgi:hypothetical protein